MASHTATSARDKSVLLQTVALLEALLGRISNLQQENDRLRSTSSDDDDDDAGEVVLALEATRAELAASRAESEALRSDLGSRSERLRELERRAAAAPEVAEMQTQVEGALRRQVADLRSKFESSMEGRLAESEMADEAVVRAGRMEGDITELEIKVSNSYHI